MAKRVSLGHNVREYIDLTLRKLRFSHKEDDTPSVTHRARHLALNRGFMAIEGLDRAIAEEFAYDLKKKIEQQAFAWVPLSPDYARRKAVLGLDPRMLIALGGYIEAIQAREQPDGTWAVTVADKKLPNSRYTYKDLANWLEWGTENMPARPHWRPTINLWKQKSYQLKMQVKYGWRTYLSRRGFR